MEAVLGDAFGFVARHAGRSPYGGHAIERLELEKTGRGESRWASRRQADYYRILMAEGHVVYRVMPASRSGGHRTHGLGQTLRSSRLELGVAEVGGGAESASVAGAKVGEDAGGLRRSAAEGLTGVR